MALARRQACLDSSHSRLRSEITLMLVTTGDNGDGKHMSVHYFVHLAVLNVSHIYKICLVCAEICAQKSNY